MRYGLILVPVVVGLIQPVLWQMNVTVARRSGDMEAAVLLHIVGAIAGLGMVLAGLRGAGGLSGLLSAPWWAWLAGVLGVAGMAAMNKTIPVLGVSAALAVLVAAQFSGSVIFEHLGWMGAEVRAATPARIGGAALLVAGAWLISR